MPALLNCQSNFSFLSAASHPEELVAQADDMGYSAIALCDELSLAGIVRAWRAARERQIRLICGCRITLEDGTQLLLLAANRRAYNQLCGLISHVRLNKPKGEYAVSRQALSRFSRHGLAVWLPSLAADQQDAGDFLRRCFAERLWLGVSLHCDAQQELRYLTCYALAKRLRLPMVAAPHIRMHCRQRQALQDVLTAIRSHCRVEQLGQQRLSNSEHYIKPLPLLSRDYPAALLEESERLAGLCEFQLNELRYQYPTELVPAKQTASAFLRDLTFAGARQRWPSGIPDKVRQQVEHELSLIAELGYEHYFLTVHDIVQFARSQNILCQGRGSAANSAVCYCLFITEVDPSRAQLLFERFISRERDEPPDIDVDFEHERREEVIQYIYRKYGRSHAALAATVISYRRRSAVRDVGRAMGFDEALISALSQNMAWWDDSASLPLRLQEVGIDSTQSKGRLFLQLVDDILGFPRHLSQHVGGFVISRAPIATLVPQENASMPGRTVIQWDKEDLESLGMMKIDILALGMLSALRRSLAYISEQVGRPMQLMDIPANDPATFDMLCAADSVGVFQIESRAQMSMLPRLRPRSFYDLVIQIAIVRPGPIQGGMVHPFLRRRQGLEDESYANEAIRSVLGRTLGVPIFQEQVIQLAMVAAGFSGGEADALRRAMASWGRNGHLAHFKPKLISGMLERGYPQDFAEQLFSQMKGFGAYGFPESHSASFALLAYASAWIKRHYPAAFFCGLLNSQPMGFYSPSQLCQDARRHGVELLPPCINHSDWAHKIDRRGSQPALRLGLCLIKGLNKALIDQLIHCREKQGLFTSIGDCLNKLSQHFSYDEHIEQALKRLAASNSFHKLEESRYQSYWQGQQYRPSAFLSAGQPQPLRLTEPAEMEQIEQDYRHTGLSLRRHPVALLREQQRLPRCLSAQQLEQVADQKWVSVAGLVTCRQRPGSAAGTLFMTLEDETGNSNIIVWPALQQRYRREILQSRLLQVSGTIQKSQGHSNGSVIHILAQSLRDYSTLLDIHPQSHDFH